MNSDQAQTGRTLSKAELLHQRIAARISTDSLKSGDRLGTRQSMKQEYGVANGTLNEALRLLVSEGLAELRPGPKGGVFVANRGASLRIGGRRLVLRGSVSDLAENLEVRYSLLPLVAASAARNPSPPQEVVSKIREQLTLLRGSELHGNELQLQVWALQRSLGELATNKLLQTLYVGLLDAAEAQLLDAIFDKPRRPNRVGLHEKLVEAVLASDPEEAVLVAHELSAFTLGPPGQPTTGLLQRRYKGGDP